MRRRPDQDATLRIAVVQPGGERSAAVQVEQVRTERRSSTPDTDPVIPDPSPADAGRRRPRFLYLTTIGLYAVPLWAVITLVFLLPRLLPGDPLSQLDDPGSGSFVYDEAARDRVAAYYGLDRPLAAQYGSYLAGF